MCLLEFHLATIQWSLININLLHSYLYLFPVLFLSYSLTSKSQMQSYNKGTRAIEEIILNQWRLIGNKEIGGIVIYSFFMLMMLGSGMKISLFLVWIAKWTLYLKRKIFPQQEATRSKVKSLMRFWLLWAPWWQLCEILKQW